MQETGLKLHMFDTFYHYQQAARAAAGTDREKRSPQPLYQGSWEDMALAPFQWDNLKSAWVYPVVAASAGFLVFQYKTTELHRLPLSVEPTENFLYGVSQMGAIPYGSAVGEEPLFRGFIQREVRLYTDSVVVSLVAQSALFSLLHPNELKATAFLGGIYFGMLTNHFDGNFEKAIAAHFWIDVLSGLTTYWVFRRVQGKDTPFAPPVTASMSIPF